MPQEKPLEILLVDDDERILNANERLLAIIMNGKRYNIDKALNGAAAMEKLEKKEHCDLIVTDFDMPIMNGAQFYRNLLAKKPELLGKVIIMSGYGAGYVQTQLAKEHIPADKMPWVMDKSDFRLNIDYIIKTYLS
jgi:CheY-like chemotaxis protein